MDLSAVNERIKIFWKQTGMKQHVLAEKIGCVQQDISKAVNNKYKPGLELITGILVAFPDISFEWLVFGRGEMKKSDVPVYNSGEVLLKTADPEVKIFSCKDCIEKEKVIVAQKITIEACRETIKLQREKIEYIEGENGKNEKAHYG